MIAFLPEGACSGHKALTSHLSRMHRVIYISRSLVGSDEHAAIVQLSSERNRQISITGLLWANDGRFAQVLEGDPDPVEAIKARITKDDRHTDVEVIFNHDVTTRQFGTWAMREADDIEATAFMLGLALSQRGSAAEKLHQIVLATVV